MSPKYTKSFFTIDVEGRQDNSRIVVVGSPTPVLQAEGIRVTVRNLLSTFQLEKLSLDNLRTKEIIIVGLPHSGISPLLYRAVITDVQWCPKTLKVCVLLVDECQSNVLVSPDQLYICPKHIAAFPTVVQQYILADILPIANIWPVEIINYLKYSLVNRPVPAVFEIKDGKYGYISPLEPDGTGFPLVCKLILQKRALPASDFPGLITDVLDQLGKDHLELLHTIMPLKRDLRTENHSVKIGTTYQAMPLPSNVYEDCYISHCVVGPWKFYLQFKHQRINYFKVQEKLKLYYETGRLKSSLLKIGSNVLCCVQNLKDEQYQRGLVTGEMHKGEVSVYMVDKGVTLKLKESAMWELPVELLDTPICMFKCSLNGLPSIVDSEMTNTFTEIILSQPLKAKIVKLDDVKVIKVSMLADGQDIIKMIKPVFKRSSLVNNSLVYISYVCEDDCVIYVQLSSEAKKLEHLQQQLQELSNSAAVIENPEVDMICSALFEDGFWYRGLILENKEFIKVKYVDYGNSSIVAPSNVRELCSELITEIPAQAIPCILSQVPAKVVNVDYVTECFGPVGEKEGIVKVEGWKKMKIGNGPYQIPVVELIEVNTKMSLNLSLVEKNKKNYPDVKSQKNVGQLPDVPQRRDAVPPPVFSIGALIEGSTTMGKTSHIPMQDQNEVGFVTGKNDSHHTGRVKISKPPEVEITQGCFRLVRMSYVGKACFYVTLQEKDGVIEDMKKKLAEGSEGASAEDARNGCLVATFDRADNSWHRGLVTGCLGHLIELFLIDSGKDIVLEKHLLQKLPDTPSLLTTPAQAIKCTLSNLTPSNLQTMQKDIGSLFMACFERIQNNLWEVKLFVETLYSSNNADTGVDKITNREIGKGKAKAQSKKETKEGEGLIATLLQKSMNVTRDDFDRCLEPNLARGHGRMTHCGKYTNTVESQKWNNETAHHSTGPIRNKSHRYHAPAAAGWDNHSKRNKSDWNRSSNSFFDVKGVQNNNSHINVTCEKPTGRSSESQLKSKKYFTKLESEKEQNNIGFVEGHKNVHDTFTKLYALSRKQEKNLVNKSIALPKKLEKQNGEDDREATSDKNVINASLNRGESHHNQSSTFKKPQNIPEAQVNFCEEFTALIANVEEDGSLWVQAFEHAASLDEMMSRLNDTCKTVLPLMNDFPKVGNSCASLYCEDGSFYRAVVKKICDDGSIVVHYVDYGNSNTVKLKELRVLPDDFFDLPCQAMHCYFTKDLREQSLPVLHRKIEEIMEKELQIILVQESLESDRIVLNKCVVSGLDVLSQLREQVEGNCNPGLEETVFSQTPSLNEGICKLAVDYEKSSQIYDMVVTFNTRFIAYVCHVDNDSSIWIQSLEQSAKLEELMEKLTEIGNSSSKALLPFPEVGKPCFCQYGGDEGFYRAVIKEVDSVSSTAQVHYVDYGNMDCTNVENLFTLPDSLLTLPRQALHCHFSRSIKSCWSLAAQQYLEAMIDKEVEISLQQADGRDETSGSFVTFCAIDGVDVLTHLLSLGDIEKSVDNELATQDKKDTTQLRFPLLPLTYGHDISAVVCHVEKTSFWIQLLDQCSSLEEMMAKLNESSIEPWLGVPTVGSLCTSRYEEDGRLYRAVVKSVNADQQSVVVQYVDYGNTGIVKLDDVFLISEDTVALPVKAVQCFFSKEVRNCWCPAAQKQIEELLDQEVVVSLVEGDGVKENQIVLSSCTLGDIDVLLAITSQNALSRNLSKIDMNDKESGLYLEKDKNNSCSDNPVIDIPLQSIRYEEEFEAFVCHVENDSIWIQLSNQSSALELVMEKLNSSDCALDAMSAFPATGSFCVSLYAEDGRYYRAVLQEVDASQACGTVHYIDYGNNGVVEKGNLFLLPKFAVDLPCQAVQCFFTEDIREQHFQSNENQIEELLDQNVNISIHLGSRNQESANIVISCTVENTDVLSDIKGSSSGLSKNILEPFFSNDQKETALCGSKDMSEQSQPREFEESNLELKVEVSSGANIPEHIDKDSVVQKEVCVEDVAAVKQVLVSPIVECDEPFPAIVSHVEEFGSLWIQKVNDASSLSDMMDSINQMSYSNFEPLQNDPKVGSMCLCPYVLDGRLYRAVVKEVGHGQDEALVHYIDYGNVESVSVEKLFKMPDCFFDLPRQAIQCYFNRDIKKYWSQAHQARVEEIVVEVTISLSCDSENDHFVFREFIVEGSDLVVLFGNELNEFFIESSLNSDLVEIITEKDNQESDLVEENDAIEERHKYDCISYKENVGMATLLSGDDVEALSMSSDLVKEPECSECHSEGIIVENVNKKAENERDSTYESDHLEQAGCFTNEFSLVDTLGTKQITLPASFKCNQSLAVTLCHVEDKGSLWMQITESIPLLNDLMDRLNKLDASSLEPLQDIPEVGSVCICPFVLDGLLYRAVVKEVDSSHCVAVVCYVDYGNQESVRVEQLRRLPQCFSDLPAQAIHCFFAEDIREHWTQTHQSRIEEVDVEVTVSLSEFGENCFIFREFIVNGINILSEFYDIKESHIHEDSVESSEIGVGFTDPTPKQASVNRNTLLDSSVSVNSSVELQSLAQLNDNWVANSKMTDQRKELSSMVEGSPELEDEAFESYKCEITDAHKDQNKLTYFGEIDSCIKASKVVVSQETIVVDAREMEVDCSKSQESEPLECDVDAYGFGMVTSSLDKSIEDLSKETVFLDTLKDKAVYEEVMLESLPPKFNCSIDEEGIKREKNFSFKCRETYKDKSKPFEEIKIGSLDATELDVPIPIDTIELDIHNQCIIEKEIVLGKIKDLGQRLGTGKLNIEQCAEMELIVSNISLSQIEIENVLHDNESEDLNRSVERDELETEVNKNSNESIENEQICDYKDPDQSAKYDGFTSQSVENEVMVSEGGGDELGTEVNKNSNESIENEQICDYKDPDQSAKYDGFTTQSVENKVMVSEEPIPKVERELILSRSGEPNQAVAEEKLISNKYEYNKQCQTAEDEIIIRELINKVERDSGQAVEEKLVSIKYEYIKLCPEKMELISSDHDDSIQSMETQITSDEHDPNQSMEGALNFSSHEISNRSAVEELAFNETKDSNQRMEKEWIYRPSEHGEPNQFTEDILDFSSLENFNNTVVEEMSALFTKLDQSNKEILDSELDDPIEKSYKPLEENGFEGFLKEDIILSQNKFRFLELKTSSPSNSERNLCCEEGSPSHFVDSEFNANERSQMDWIVPFDINSIELVETRFVSKESENNSTIDIDKIGVDDEYDEETGSDVARSFRENTNSENRISAIESSWNKVLSLWGDKSTWETKMYIDLELNDENERIKHDVIERLDLAVGPGDLSSMKSLVCTGSLEHLDVRQGRSCKTLYQEIKIVSSNGSLDTCDYKETVDIKNFGINETGETDMVIGQLHEAHEIVASKISRYFNQNRSEFADQKEEVSMREENTFQGIAKFCRGEEVENDIVRDHLSGFGREIPTDFKESYGSTKDDLKLSSIKDLSDGEDQTCMIEFRKSHHGEVCSFTNEDKSFDVRNESFEEAIKQLFWEGTQEINGNEFIRSELKHSCVDKEAEEINICSVTEQTIDSESTEDHSFGKAESLSGNEMVFVPACQKFPEKNCFFIDKTRENLRNSHEDTLIEEYSSFNTPQEEEDQDLEDTISGVDPAKTVNMYSQNIEVSPVNISISLLQEVEVDDELEECSLFSFAKEHSDDNEQTEANVTHCRDVINPIISPRIETSGEFNHSGGDSITPDPEGGVSFKSVDPERGGSLRLINPKIDGAASPGDLEGAECDDGSKKACKYPLMHGVYAVGPVFKQQPKIKSGSSMFIIHAELNQGSVGSGKLSLQLEDDLKRGEDIQQCISEITDELQETSNIQTGEACLAQCFGDGRWCRATVLNIKDSVVSVCLVDYGKTGITSLVKLRQIPDNLLDPPCSYICDFRYREEDTKEMSFLEKCREQYVKQPVVLSAVDEGTEQKLTLHHCGKEILKEITIVFKTCTRMSVPTSKHACLTASPSYANASPGVEFITAGKSRVMNKFRRFLYSIKEEEEGETDNTGVMEYYKALLINIDEDPFSLWVQREDDLAFAEFMEELLEKEVADFEELEDPVRGQLCLSVLKDKKQRVKLISFDQFTAHVHFIDQGRYGIVSRSELWKLKDELKDIHPLASQLFLPVIITKGMESVSVLAIAEVALGEQVFCIDVRTKADRKIKTVAICNEVGDLSKYLVKCKLASLLNFESDICTQLTTLINKFCHNADM